MFREPRTAKHITEKATLTLKDLRQIQDQLSKDIEFITAKSAIQRDKTKSRGPDFKERDPVYLLRKNIKTKRPSSKLDFTKLGPFKITEVMGKVNYRLNLPKTMRIHPVFHVSLLEPAPQHAKATQVEVESDTEEYDVERILNRKVIRGEPHYLVKW